MVIAVGTRFKDINLARLGQSAALRSLEHDQHILEGKKLQVNAEGLVIIDNQPTVFDDICQIRIWDESDAIIETVCKKLKIAIKKECKCITPGDKWNSFVHNTYRKKIDPEDIHCIGFLPKAYYDK